VDSDIDTVLHLAATTFVPESFEFCYDYYDFNIRATLNISEFCKKRKVKKLIYMNTYVYGNPDKLPIDENHRIKLPSPYHKSKQLAEDLAINYFEANETKVISLRVFNLFGEGQGENFLVPMLVRQSLYSNQFEVLDLEPKRDFFYIKDFTNLIKKNNRKTSHKKWYL
jgi:UDP-glucose 4-epimerase